MSLTRPVPNVCRFIVDAIRRKVPRPHNSPNFVKYSLRFGSYCPMGLLPGSPDVAPIKGFGRFGTCSVEAFADWWDEQTDAKAATDAVWGPKPKKRRKRGPKPKKRRKQR